MEHSNELIIYGSSHLCKHHHFEVSISDVPKFTKITLKARGGQQLRHVKNDIVREIHRDFQGVILIVLGGNDIRSDVRLGRKGEECFLKNARTIFNENQSSAFPKAILMAGLIPSLEKATDEIRTANNHLRSLIRKHYSQLVQYVNVPKKLCRPGGIPDQELYQDDVHLNVQGAIKLKNILMTAARSAKFPNRFRFL